MKKLKFFSLFLVFALLGASLAALPAQALDKPAVQSADIALIDAATGNVLFSQNADAKAYPAAAAQTMTALLAVEAIETGKAALSDAITVTPDGLGAAAADDGKAVTFSNGETTTLENLLYSAMLTSSTDACAAVAQHISGGTAAFVEAMNARAKALGCTGTSFANPGGSQNTNQYTTAGDLAKIAKEAASHSLFMQICSTATRTVPATNASDERQLTNGNGLVNQDAAKYGRYFYQYAAGIKAGTSSEAGYCLVSSASKNGVKLICVVLGGKAVPENGDTAYTNYADTATLYSWAFENFEYREVIKMTENVKDVPVKMGHETNAVAVHPEASVKVLVPKDEDVSDFTTKVTIYSEQEGKDPLTAPIEAGAVLGEITAERDGAVYGSAKLLASNSVDLSYMQYLGARMAKTLLTPGAFIFFGVVIFLIVWYCSIVSNYNKRRKAGEAAAPVSEPEPKPKKAKRLPAMAAKGAPDNAATEDAFTDEATEPLSDSTEEQKKAEEQAERDYFAEFFGGKSDK